MVNILSGNRDRLIDGSAQNLARQDAIFFEMRGSDSRYDFYFFTVELNDEGKYEQNWCRYRIDQDMLTFLRQNGRLPVESLEQPVQLIKENKQ